MSDCLVQRINALRKLWCLQNGLNLWLFWWQRGNHMMNMLSFSPCFSHMFTCFTGLFLKTSFAFAQATCCSFCQSGCDARCDEWFVQHRSQADRFQFANAAACKLFICSIPHTTDAWRLYFWCVSSACRGEVWFHCLKKNLIILYLRACDWSFGKRKSTLAHTSKVPQVTCVHISVLPAGK